METSIPAGRNAQTWVIVALALPAAVALAVNLALTQSVCVPHLVGGGVISTFVVALISQFAFSALGVLLLIFRYAFMRAGPGWNGPLPGRAASPPSAQAR